MKEISLRDYAEIQILQGLMANPTQATARNISKAVEIADAWLQTRAARVPVVPQISDDE